MSEHAPARDELDARGMRLAVVAGRFNEHITQPLLDGALDALEKSGLARSDVQVHWVPGAFELPLLAQHLARSGRVDAVVCIGAVVRGDTPHFEYVARSCADGLARVALDTGLPVVFGVLTTDDEQQALDRAGGVAGNKGAEAALAAVEMVTLLRELPC